jgi:Metallo-beta-lactamase superfamily
MLRVKVFDVGQASSVLLDFGRGRLGVIDAGVDASGRNPLAAAIRQRFAEDPVCTVVFVLLTHLDWDHISGAAGLGDPAIRPRVRRLYCNGLGFRTLFEVVERFAQENQKARFDRNRTTSRNLGALGVLGSLLAAPPVGAGDFHGELVAPEASDPEAYPVLLKIKELGEEFVLRLFAPSQDLRDRAASGLSRRVDRFSSSSYRDLLVSVGRSRPEWNAASAVLTIEHKGKRLLFGGDANHLTWRDIFGRDVDGRLVRSDLSLACHHGARLGSHGGEDYDDKVWRSVLGVGQPSPFVLISHGCGRYGHPHDETVHAVKRRGGLVACTQLRDRSASDAKEREELVRSLNLDDFPGDLDEWEIIDTDHNSCSGTLTAEIDDGGRLSVTAAGPRQVGSAALPACCLYVPT